MARRLWITTLCTGLCASLLPGCALVQNWRNQGGDANCKVPAPPTAVEPQLPAPAESTAVSPPAPSPYLATTQRTHNYLTNPSAEQEEQQPRAEAPEPPRQELPEQQHPVNAPGPEVKPEAPKEPLVEALSRFLEDHPEEALTYLQRYDERSQELFLRLLPLLTHLTRKGPGQLEPEEIKALSDELQGLMVSLRYRADLGIETMCFCSLVKGYGDYVALPAEHSFRPETPAQPGEQVQLYVELRNFCMEPCSDGFEARLSSSVQIHDPQGQCVWESSFDGERRLQTRTLRRDHCNNYRFYVPPIPSGDYTLTLQVRDVTRPASPRTARKAVAFRVGP